MTPPRYRAIVEHYEACLERNGDTHLGVDWPKPEDVPIRHRVMLDVIRRPLADTPVRLLDRRLLRLLRLSISARRFNAS